VFPRANVSGSMRSLPGRAPVGRPDADSPCERFINGPSSGPPEPDLDVLCDLTTYGRQGKSPQGALLCIALHDDVTIGDVEIAPL
jgi:hypothetical protein